MGGPLPPLQRHLAVNIVPGGSGMGPWHSTISPLRAGVAFVDNLKKKNTIRYSGPSCSYRALP